MLLKLEALGQSAEQLSAREVISVVFDLVLEGAEASRGASLDYLLDHATDELVVVLEREHEVTFHGVSLEFWQELLVKLGHSVDLADLADRCEEVIGGACRLALEVGKPEGPRGFVRQRVANPRGEVIVDDVFEVDLIEVVGPRVQHREALVLNALGAVLEDIVLKELEVRFVGADRVG